MELLLLTKESVEQSLSEAKAKKEDIIVANQDSITCWDGQWNMEKMRLLVYNNEVSKVHGMCVWLSRSGDEYE